MNPTNDSRIFETQWFVNPNQPLIENKIYYAKADNMLWCIAAQRGPTTDNVALSKEIKTYMLVDDNGMEDTSLDAFNTLQKFLDKPN